jgi:hypothetical protein
MPTFAQIAPSGLRVIEQGVTTEPTRISNHEITRLEQSVKNARTQYQRRMGKRYQAPRGPLPEYVDVIKALKHRLWTGYNGARFKITQDDLYPFSMPVYVEQLGLALSLFGEGLPKGSRGRNIHQERFAATLERMREIYRKKGEAWRVIERAAEAHANGAGYCLIWNGQRVQENQNPALKALRYVIERTAERRERRAASAPSYHLDVDVIPEIIETGETLHFSASQTQSGYGRLVIDGRDVERVRVWNCDEPTASDKPALKFYFNTDLTALAVQCWGDFARLVTHSVNSARAMLSRAHVILEAIAQHTHEHMAQEIERAAKAIQKGYALEFTSQRQPCDAPLGILPRIAAALERLPALLKQPTSQPVTAPTARVMDNMPEAARVKLNGASHAVYGDCQGRRTLRGDVWIKGDGVLPRALWNEAQAVRYTPRTAPTLRDSSPIGA